VLCLPAVVHTGPPNRKAAARVQEAILPEGRHRRAQAAWCARNPDYFAARRILTRQSAKRPPQPLKLPPPLSKLPWDIAQDEFGSQGADFLGVMGTLILGAAQDEIRGYLSDSAMDTGLLRGIGRIGCLVQSSLRQVPCLQLLITGAMSTSMYAPWTAAGFYT